MKRVGTWAAWWLGLFWLWLLLAGEWNRTEWVAAAIAATVATALGAVAQVRIGFSARLPLRALADLPQLLAAVVVDFGILVWALAESVARRRVVRGRFVTRTRPTGDGGAAGVGLRAWLEVAATYSPNAYVVEIEPSADTVLLHDLRPNRFSESPVA